MKVRRHGAAGPRVVCLHGGPGAPGTMASLARALQDRWEVLEPLQRLSGDTPLSVAVHVEDLHGVMDRPAALVGSSWGAMLALCYAAEHPGLVERLVLIGGGTWDKAARAQLVATRDGRMTDATRARFEELAAEPERNFEALGDLIFPLYCYDAVTDDLEVEAYDYRGHMETWEDLVRLQEEGIYPARFSRIQTPVVMLHGDHDPHPGPAIRDSLAPHLRDLTYRSFARCDPESASRAARA